MPFFNQTYRWNGGVPSRLNREEILPGEIDPRSVRVRVTSAGNDQAGHSVRANAFGNILVTEGAASGFHGKRVSKNVSVSCVYFQKPIELTSKEPNLKGRHKLFLDLAADDSETTFDEVVNMAGNTVTAAEIVHVDGHPGADFTLVTDGSGTLRLKGGFQDMDGVDMPRTAALTCLVTLG